MHARDLAAVAAFAGVFAYAVRRRLRAAARGGGGAPRFVVVFSGKRKSGKDYVTDRLLAGLTDAHAAIGRLSAPLKQAYADEHGLDFKELLSDGPYKEKYRADMIVWGEQKRNADPGFFARLVLASAAKGGRPVLIVSDARRGTDLAFFRREFAGRMLAVRVRASDATRAGRAWVFTPGVDDVESECGLDGAAHDVTVDNDGDADALAKALRELEQRVRAAAGLPAQS